MQDEKIQDYMMKLGEIIRQIRTARKLTQSEFADVTGLSRKTVQNIEQGKGFNMESFLLILSYTSVDQDLFEWFKDKTKNLCQVL